MEKSGGQAAGQTVLGWLAGVGVGEGTTHGKMVVFPAYSPEAHAGETPEALRYLTLHEAIADEGVTVTEQPSASVPDLVLWNRGQAMVPELAIEMKRAIA